MESFLTSSRVDKSKTSLAPKVKPRAPLARNSSQPQEPPAHSTPSTAVVAPPVVAQEELPTQSQDSVVHEPELTSAPTVAAVVATATADKPARAIITASRPSIVPESSGDIIENPQSSVTIKNLVSQKFEHGKLSKFEESRRLEMLENKKKRKLEKFMKTEDVKPAKIVNLKKEAPNEIQSRGPKLRVVNGELQLDQTSLLVDNPKGPDEDEFERVEEGSLRYVSSMSFRVKPLTGRVKWTAAMTDRFYQGLEFFGTDFSLISLMFPALTRAQIKLKFNSEERINAKRVDLALKTRKKPDESLRAEMQSLRVKKQLKEEAKASAPLPSNPTGPSSSNANASETNNPADDTDENEQQPEDEENQAPQPVQKQKDIIEETIQNQSTQALETAILSSHVSSSLNKDKSKIAPKIAPRARARAKQT